MTITTDNSRKVYVEITKTTIVIGLIFLAVGYFIGNVIPITKNSQPNMEQGTITSTTGVDQLSKPKIQGSVTLRFQSLSNFRVQSLRPWIW